MGCGTLKVRKLYDADIQYIHLYGEDYEPTDGSQSTKVGKTRKKRFDDMRLLEKADGYHIDRIEFFVAEGLVTGIGVSYNLDGI